MSDRKNIAAFTEGANHYPGYVSINRESDGRYTITVRERGHDGTKVATVHIPPEALQVLAADTLTNLGPDI